MLDPVLGLVLAGKYMPSDPEAPALDHAPERLDVGAPHVVGANVQPDRQPLRIVSLLHQSERAVQIEVVPGQEPQCRVGLQSQ